MRRLHLTLASVLPLLAAAPVPSAPRPALRIRRAKTDRWLEGHRFHAAISYPQVTGLPDSRVERQINALLATRFPPGGLQHDAHQAVDGIDPKQTVELEGAGRATLNRGRVLSVYFTGLENPVEDGRIAAAHPEKLASAVTLDTRTGREYRLADLFSGPGWQKRLDEIVVDRLSHAVPDLDADQSRDAVAQHQFGFYLTPNGLTLFNLFDAFALASIEVAIPARELRAIANPRGPLHGLVR